MLPTSAPAIPAASRRAKRIIESTTPSSSEADESRGDLVDDDVEEEVEADAQAEDDDTEDEAGVAYTRSAGEY